MEFDPDVEATIEGDVPVIWRSFARKGLQDFAREKGSERVTMEIFLEARAKFLGTKAPPPS